jgi:hypothetical protein
LSTVPVFLSRYGVSVPEHQEYHQMLSFIVLGEQS